MLGAYLNARRPKLERRSITGGPTLEQQWYQYGRSQSLIKFDRDKIILPILSLEPRYAYDNQNTLVTGGGNGPYYLIRPRPGVTVSNCYLLAVLNHPLSEAFVRNNTSSFKGGYYSHGKQFIETLPVPMAGESTRDAIDALVRTLIDRLDDLDAPLIPHEKLLLRREITDVKRRIKQSTNKLFGLSDDDQRVTKAVPIPD